jgi:predicted dehydrogenase
MTLSLGLVGHGRWGRNIERTLLTFPDVSVAIIARGEKPPSGLDGVLIATKSTTHAQYALPYIEAGVATFIEKPMTTTLADAERIRQASERSGALVFVGHIMLFHPAFAVALALLPSLGAVRYLLSEGMNGSMRSDSSVLWDWLPHEISMARAILNQEPHRATTWRLAGDEMLTAATTRIEFGSVSLVSAVSWLSPVRRRRLVVGCDGGTLFFDDIAGQRLTLYRGDDKPSYPAYADELPLTREMAAFIEAIRAGKRDDGHLRAGVSIVRAIAAAERSAALGGQPVDI